MSFPYLLRLADPATLLTLTMAQRVLE